MHFYVWNLYGNSLWFIPSSYVCVVRMLLCVWFLCQLMTHFRPLFLMWMWILLLPWLLLFPLIPLKMLFPFYQLTSHLVHFTILTSYTWEAQYYNPYHWIRQYPTSVGFTLLIEWCWHQFHTMPGIEPWVFMFEVTLLTSSPSSRGERKRSSKKHSNGKLSMIF